MSNGLLQLATLGKCVATASSP